jgi:fluoride exporter
MPHIVWIALGGAAGTASRYYVSLWLLDALGPAFPYGTLAVNLLGSLLLGVLVGVGQSSEIVGPTLMIALTTGLLGGFTTYSTFSVDTWRYLHAGTWSLAAVYVLAMVGGCLLATGAGFSAGSWLVAGSTAARH